MTQTDIQSAITSSGLSLYRISKEIGCSWITVKRWSIGRTKPNWNNQKRLKEIGVINDNREI
jgi:hypothetical protein